MKYSETWELGTPKGLWKTVLQSDVVLFLRSSSMYWLGLGTGVAVLNSQVVPISQVVLKVGFTVYDKLVAGLHYTASYVTVLGGYLTLNTSSPDTSAWWSVYQFQPYFKLLWSVTRRCVVTGHGALTVGQGFHGERHSTPMAHGLL